MNPPGRDPLGSDPLAMVTLGPPGRDPLAMVTLKPPGRDPQGWHFPDSDFPTMRTPETPQAGTPGQ